MERLLETIQARKLDRLAAGYAVGAWLLVQAASIALPAFDAPGWLLKALILLSVLGFPLVITVGWMGAPHLATVSAGGPRRPLAQLAAIAVLATVLVLIAAEVVYRVARQDANTAA